MVKTKISPTKNRSGRGGVRMQVRDLKSKTVPRDVFTIQHLKAEQEGLEVEPLIEDDELTIEQDFDYQPVRPLRMNVTPLQQEEEVIKMPLTSPPEPKDTIKVKFGKFVQLVANHDFAEVIDAHTDDEIIMSSNLLTELAGASDKKEERKIPFVFLIGIAIGVVLTFIFFSQP
jgi:hypothetical protein